MFDKQHVSCIKQDIHQIKKVTNGTITQPRQASLLVKVTLLAVVGSDCMAKRQVHVSFTRRPHWGPLRFVWNGEFANRGFVFGVPVLPCHWLVCFLPLHTGGQTVEVRSSL